MHTVRDVEIRFLRTGEHWHDVDKRSMEIGIPSISKEKAKKISTESLVKTMDRGCLPCAAGWYKTPI